MATCWLSLISGDRYGCAGDYEHDLIKNFREGCPADLNDVRCALRKVEEIQHWLARSNHFKILITGKMGTGKSTLVKGLTEDYEPETEHLLPHTVKVTPYSYERDKISLTIFDTPGLKDDVKGSNDYSYLTDMVKNSQEPNLLIFAIRMDDTDFRKEDMSAINNISAAFGWKVWKNAMIILTFANKVRIEGKAFDSRENKVYYNKIRGKFALKITEILREYKVQEDIANNIPIVPVGLVHQPLIPSDERRVSWVQEFWDTVHSRLKVIRQEMARENAVKPTDPPPPSPPEPPVYFVPYQRPAYVDFFILVFGVPIGLCCFCYCGVCFLSNLAKN